MIIINPGTERNPAATLTNAEAVAAIIIADLKLTNRSCERAPNRDRDGWFGFNLSNNHGAVVEVDIPGDEPSDVVLGQPFVSRRLYVNGSSWLYGFALNRIEESMP